MYVAQGLIQHKSMLSHVRLFAIPWMVAHHKIPGKNAEAGCHFLLQGILPTQGSNPHVLHLLHWQVDSLPRAPLGKPSSPLQ